MRAAWCPDTKCWNKVVLLRHKEGALSTIWYFKYQQVRRAWNKEKGDSIDVCSLLHLPTEFFHPACAAIPAPHRSRSLRLTQGLRLTSPASWASLHSAGAHSKMLCTQVGSEVKLQSVIASHVTNDACKTCFLCCLHLCTLFSDPTPQHFPVPVP